MKTPAGRRATRPPALRGVCSVGSPSVLHLQPGRLGQAVEEGGLGDEVDDLGDLVVAVELPQAGDVGVGDERRVGRQLPREGERGPGRGGLGVPSVQGEDVVVAQAVGVQAAAGLVDGVPGAVVAGGDVGDLGAELRGETALSPRRRAWRSERRRPWGSSPGDGPTGGPSRPLRDRRGGRPARRPRTPGAASASATGPRRSPVQCRPASPAASGPGGKGNRHLSPVPSAVARDAPQGLPCESQPEPTRNGTRRTRGRAAKLLTHGAPIATVKLPGVPAGGRDASPSPTSN